MAESGSHRVAILVALIGLVGSLGAALIGNRDRIIGGGAQHATGATLTVQPAPSATTAPARAPSVEPGAGEARPEPNAGTSADPKGTGGGAATRRVIEVAGEWYDPRAIALRQ